MREAGLSARRSPRKRDHSQGLCARRWPYNTRTPASAPPVSDSTAMTSSKLGFLPSSVLASVLATAVSLAPVQAVAAPPEEAPEGEEGSVEVGAPEEGETAEGETPEGETPVEIEPPVEEPTDEGEVEGEGEGEEEPAAEEVPTAIEDSGPLRPPEPTWGPKSQYPRNGKGMLITGGITTGLGAAFIVTSILLTRCDFDSALSCKFGDQRDFLVPTAVATTGLGLLLIGVGVANHVKYKKWQNWTPETAVVPSYVPGGGGVAWVGRF